MFAIDIPEVFHHFSICGYVTRGARLGAVSFFSLSASLSRLEERQRCSLLEAGRANRA